MPLRVQLKRDIPQENNTSAQPRMPINTGKTMVFYSRSDTDALAVLRVTGPAEQAGYHVLEGAKGGVPQIELVRQADIVLIQRDFCQYLDAFQQILDLAHALQKPVIFDIDDMLFELPENHPDRLSHYYTASLLPMLLAVIQVDLVTTSTPNLREYLLPFNNNIRLLPNYLNDTLWTLREPPSGQNPQTPLTIGYMGGASHKPDLQHVLPALQQIVQKYPGQIRFHFWGIQPPAEIAALSQVDWSPPVSRHYADFAHYFQTQSADIVISPLVDHPFNAYKSPIKFFEYSAIGAPGVYSRVRTYSDIIQNGKEGLLAETMDEWVDAISQLIENPARRSEIVLSAQQNIRQSWLLSQNIEYIQQTYASAVYLPPENRQLPSFYPLIRSLAWQYYETGQDMQRQVQSLASQLETASRSLQDLTRQAREKDQSLRTFTGELERKDEMLSNLRDQLFEAEEMLQTSKKLLSEKVKLSESYKKKLLQKEQGFGELKDMLTEKDEDVNQLREQLGENGDAIRTLNAKLAEKDQAIRWLTNLLAQAEEEAVSYAASRSWRITRPLRKISGRLPRGKR